MACLPSQLIRFLTPSDLQLACQVEPDNNMHQIEIFCLLKIFTDILPGALHCTSLQADLWLASKWQEKGKS